MPADFSPDQITSHLGDILVALNEIDVHEPEVAAEHRAYHTAIEGLVAIVQDLSDQLVETRVRLNWLEARVSGDLMRGVPAIGEEEWPHPMALPLSA